MLADLQGKIKELLYHSIAKFQLSNESIPSLELEIPTEKRFGDFSSNLALKLSKVLRQAPIQIAEEIVSELKHSLNTSPIKDKVRQVEIVKPGFINFHLAPQAFYEVLTQVLKEKMDFGRVNFGQKKRIQIEFVSANPTGPLSVAHGRQAAVGDALGNIFSHIGFDVTKEYYVNDEGNQINILGRSVMFRAQEIFGQTVQFPEDCYQGEYIKDLARQFLDERKIKSLSDLNSLALSVFSQFAVDVLMAIIKKELEDFRVGFNVWTKQSVVAKEEYVQKLLEDLKTKKFIFEKEGAWWFQSTQFGDDKDRVVKKSDGSFTYLAPDIVYHKDKFDRGFFKVINMWGPDHHGYIQRLKAAVAALGFDPNALDVLIVQLATIYRDGQEVSMSTRRGQYISLREVMDEVGVDAARYFFLQRRISAHLEFDLELAKKETPENPVFYIQYAHARIHSIIKKAREANVEPKLAGFSLIKEVEEVELLKKIGEFPDCLIMCYSQFDPYPVVNYLHELAIEFHRFYDRHRIVDEADPVSKERLALCEATRMTIANGLRLLGVSTPEKM